MNDEAFTQRAGDIIDVDPAEAQRLIAAGSAEPVKQTQAEKRETRTAA